MLIFALQIINAMKRVSLLLVVLLALTGMRADAQRVSLGKGPSVDTMLTIRKAYAYNLTSLDTSLAILQAMRERKMEPEWRLNLAEGDMYSNTRLVQKAIPFYEKALADESISDSIRMALYKRMMDGYDLIHDEDHLMIYIYKMKEMAERLHDNHFLALAEFMAGKRLHLQGDTQKGYDMCLHALELMKTSTNPRKINELRAFYADLIRMYTRDRRFDDAVELTVLHEEAARDSSKLNIQKLDDRALRRVYALRATLLAEAGRMVEADAAYTLWQGTTGGNAVDDTEILPYLILSGHNEEALGVIRRCREFLAVVGDTISYWNLKMIFNEVQVLAEMGEHDSALEYLDDAMIIADSIHVRASQIEMTTTYQLLEEQKQAHRHSLKVNWLIALLILVLLTAALVFYFNRVINRRNKLLTKVLNGLDTYRQAVISGQPLTSPEVVAAFEDIRSMSDEAGLTADKTEEPDDEDRRLFLEMDTQVTRDKLFLNPRLGRDELARLIGVDKNRFGKMMGKYSDASNAAVYVNMKRVAYAAKLLLEHPEYTIATIANECGMSNTVTFNRTFKSVYGMTPSEYRSKAASLASISE